MKKYTKDKPIVKFTKEEISKKKPSKTDQKSGDVDDPEFAEFLEVHSKRQKDKSIWDNDGIDGSTIKTTSAPDEEEPATTIAHNKELTDLQVS